VKSTEHAGQRKLLLAEVEFLTQHARHGDTVVYIGAAPGGHIPFLIHLFSEVAEWHLFDPRESAARACVSAHVHIHKECFTDKVRRAAHVYHAFLHLCVQWAAVFAENAAQTVFISDMRSFGVQQHWQCMALEAIENCVSSDMAQQMHWQERMRPRAAMHKFRLPYTAGATMYMDGELRFSVYGPPTSTETRLWVVQPSGTRVYDHQTYTEQVHVL
jgi:hypothetical protein